jgi:high affinity Mn2+ porin
MPVRANGQELQALLARAQGDNLELTLAPSKSAPVLRLLAFRNPARMGDYREALHRAAAAGTLPDIIADDREGRKKYGFGINAQQALAYRALTRSRLSHTAEQALLALRILRVVALRRNEYGAH